MSDRDCKIENRQTWLISLWIHNSEPLNKAVDAIIVDLLRSMSVKNHYCYQPDSFDKASAILADRLKKFFAESTPVKSGLYLDLITHSLEQVKWEDLARSILSQVMSE